MPLLKRGIITPFARKKKRKKVLSKEAKELKRLKKMVAKRSRG